MREHMISGVNIRMWKEVKKDLQEAAREMGITASTLARLIIERSLKYGDYAEVTIPNNLLPVQEYREDPIEKDRKNIAREYAFKGIDGLYSELHNYPLPVEGHGEEVKDADL